MIPVQCDESQSCAKPDTECSGGICVCVAGYHIEVSSGDCVEDSNEGTSITRLPSVTDLRGRSFLSPNTRLECFLRGAKFLAKNLSGLKITWKTLMGLKIFPSEIFHVFFGFYSYLSEFELKSA